MATYQLKHTGQEIDAAVDWVKNSSSTAENKIGEHTLEIDMLNDAIGNPGWFSENNTTVAEQLGNHSNLLQAHAQMLNNYQRYDMGLTGLSNTADQTQGSGIVFWKSGFFVFLEINAITNSYVPQGAYVSFPETLPKQVEPTWNVFMMNAYPDSSHQSMWLAERKLFLYGMTPGQSIYYSAMYIAKDNMPFYDSNNQLITDYKRPDEE